MPKNDKTLDTQDTLSDDDVPEGSSNSFRDTIWSTIAGVFLHLFTSSS